MSYLFVEALEVVLVFGNLSEQFHAFLDQVLANNFQNFGLLEHLALKHILSFKFALSVNQ